jgi:hypothetical protein
VGTRILELLSYRDKQMKRKPEVLDILRFVHSVVWPYMFGKAADDLQQANAVGGCALRCAAPCPAAAQAVGWALATARHGSTLMPGQRR